MDNTKNDRKQEFLDAALELFNEKGYDKTTINDIINKVGVSKGAFYHYFKSKEDVIETIADDYTERILYAIKKICNSEDLDALEKLNSCIESAQQQKEIENDRRNKIKRAFNGEENLKLEKKIINKISEKFTPYIRKIFDEGIEQKKFNITNSKELPKIFLSMGNVLNTSIEELVIKRYEEASISVEEFHKELEAKLSFYEEVYGKIFGLEKGAVKIKEPYMKRFINKK